MTKFVLGLFVFLFSTGLPLLGETLTIEGYRMVLAKGFKVVSEEGSGPYEVLTPNSLPVNFYPLEKTEDRTWQATALDYLMANVARDNPRIQPTDIPESIQIKREGLWTTIYWTYGGTNAYFGMYWGGQAQDQTIVVFWADPLKARGRSQYQALSEVTKGVQLEPS